MRRVLGASCYTPRVCLPLCGGARAKQNRRSDSCSSAPQNKTPVFTVFTVFAVSAARSGTANLSGYSEFLCKKITAGQGCSQIYRRVMLSNLMTAGVCCLRWRDACMRIMRIMRIMRRVLGASCYTPRVCLPLCGGARAKQNRRSDSCSSAPQNKTPVFTVFTVFAVSAARSGTANLSGYSEFLCKKITAGQGCSQIYRRVMLSNLMTAGVCVLRGRDALV